VNSRPQKRTPEDLNWSFLNLSEMSSQTFFCLARLRTDVFVVEQQCIYPELDDHDADDSTLHVLGYSANHELLACARIIFIDLKPLSIPPALANAEAKVEENAESGSAVETHVRIGRVAVVQNHRGAGIARLMMKEILERIRLYSVERDCQLQVELSAQTYATGFYESLGFETVSEEYLEDGIEHIDMRLKPG